MGCDMFQVVQSHRVTHIFFGPGGKQGSDPDVVGPVRFCLDRLGWGVGGAARQEMGGQLFHSRHGQIGLAHMHSVSTCNHGYIQKIVDNKRHMGVCGDFPDFFTFCHHRFPILFPGFFPVLKDIDAAVHQQLGRGHIGPAQRE